MSQAKKAAKQWKVGDFCINHYKGKTNFIWQLEKIEHRGSEANYSPLLSIKQVMDIYNPEKKVWARSTLDASYISKFDPEQTFKDIKHALDVLKEKFKL